MRFLCCFLALIIFLGCCCRDAAGQIPRVLSWNILNTVDQKKYSIWNNAYIYLNNYPGVTSPTQLNFVANSEYTLTMYFGWNSTSNYRRDPMSPFSLCGDNGGYPFYTCAHMKFGRNCLYATPMNSIWQGHTSSICFNLLPARPTPAPIQSLTKAPTNAPTQAPTLSPTLSPTRRMTLTPTFTPVNCTIPQFHGEWEAVSPYPLVTGEGYGGLIDNELVVISGYFKGNTKTTPTVYSFDTTDVTGNSTWREMEPMPLIDGIGPLSSGAHVVVGDSIYICGGVVIGEVMNLSSSDACLMYTHSNPLGMQWATLPSLPSARVAGGLFYNPDRNSLIYFAGYGYPNQMDTRETTELTNVTELRLDFLSDGWIDRGNLLIGSSHFGFTTVKYHKDNKNKYFIMGGQRKGERKNPMQDIVNPRYTGKAQKHKFLNRLYEYDGETNLWIPRALMPRSRGSIGSSTIPYQSCGFITAGGEGSFKRILTDVSYYSIDTNSWTSLGNVPFARKSPVCSIANGYMYCQIGAPRGASFWRRRIE